MIYRKCPYPCQQMIPEKDKFLGVYYCPKCGKLMQEVWEDRVTAWRKKERVLCLRPVEEQP